MFPSIGRVCRYPWEIYHDYVTDIWERALERWTLPRHSIFDNGYGFGTRIREPFAFEPQMSWSSPSE
jgi:hypothetical protein